MTFAIVDGNSNNDAHVGTFYLNLNNTVSNSNWNIGTADSYHNFGMITKYTPNSSPLGENKLNSKHLLVA